MIKLITKDFFILTIGKILQVVIALLAIRLLTTVLSEKEVGHYYLLLTVLTLFNFAFLNPVGQYYNRHIIKWRSSGDLSNATFILLLTRFFGVFLSLLVACVLFVAFHYEKYFSLPEFLLFIFISLMAGSYLVVLNVINILGERVFFIKYLLFALILGLIFALLVTNFLDKSGMAWLYSVALAQLIFFVPIYRKLHIRSEFSLKRITQKINVTVIKKVFSFAVPVTLTLFLQWGQNSSYRLIIEDKYSVEVLAYIAVGFSVSAAIFNAVESLATQYFMPLYLKAVTNTTKDKRALAWDELASYMLPIYFALMIFVISLAPFIMKLLIAEKFYDAYIYAMFGALIEFLRVTANILYLVSQSEVKTRQTITPYLLGFISTVTVLYFTDLHDMLWTIPVVLAASYFLILTLLYINMRKVLSIKLPVLNIVKSIVLSLPFLFFLMVQEKQSFIFSFFLVFLGGLYFLFLLYIIKSDQNKKQPIDFI